MASTYVSGRHDLAVTDNTTSDLVGMMLAQKNGTPVYSVFDDEYLAQQLFTGTPGYSNLPSEKELAIRQDDWRAGLGQEFMDDIRSYHKSTMDMRFKGMGFAGTKSTAITVLPSTPTIVNADMELDANWTNGARSDTHNHTAGGTYAWLVNVPATKVYQDITGYSVGRQYTVTVWHWSHVDHTQQGRVNINDGVGITSSSWGVGTSDWEQLSVTRILSINATQLRIEFELEAGGTSCWFDDVAVTISTYGTCVAMAEFNDSLYFSFGKFLCKLNAAGSGLIDIKEFAATITDLEVFSDNKLYIAQGLAAAYWEMTTAEAFTVNTLANNTMKYLCFVRTTADTMYGSDSVSTIRSTTNPADGGTAWSNPATSVGSSYHDITKPLSKSGALYIMKEDKPYYLSSSGAVQSDLAPELETLTKSTDNGKNACVWLNRLYMPWGDQSLLEYDDGTNTWRSPALDVSNAEEFNGKVFAVYGDDMYLYAILDYAVSIRVLAGRYEVIDGSTQWVWHCINNTVLTGCETAFISSIYQKRLWISSTNSANNLYYIPLPTGYADIVNDANRSFQTGTTMETSWLHGNFRSTTKAFPELELVMGHTYNAGRYFTVKYKKLGDSSWTTIGNYTGSATSMTQSRYIPADASSNNPVSTMFKLQFTAVTNDTTVTPILLSYHLTGILYPPQRQIIACTVRCANEIQTKLGGEAGIEKGNYTLIKNCLERARQATYPISIRDIDGTTKTVKFLPLPSDIPQWTLIRGEKDRVQERHYNILAQCIDIS